MSVYSDYVARIFSILSENREILIDPIDESSIPKSNILLALTCMSKEKRSISVVEKFSELFTNNGRLLNFDLEKDKSIPLNEFNFSTQTDILLPEDEIKETIFLSHFLKSKCDSTSPIILIDYSCMPTTFLLRLVAAIGQMKNVEAYFGYNLGKRQKGDWEPSPVNDILAIDGLSGETSIDGKDTFLFSLGYDGATSAALEEFFQPHLVYSMIADPGAADDSARRAKLNNVDVIEQSEALLTAGIDDVCSVIGKCKELIGIGEPDSGLICIPIGPKSHVLALGLLALMHEQVTCMAISNRSSAFHPVQSSEKTSWTRVIIRDSEGQKDNSI